MLCFSLTALLYSCEKTADQSTTGNVAYNGQLASRTVEDCEDCPENYCCCGIELYGTTTSANIDVCGFSNGTYSCGIYFPSGCSAFGGYGENFQLDETDLPRVAVCKEENGVFRIYNNESYTITIRITCQHDISSPQWVTINIPATSAVFYHINGDCEVVQC